ncbi:MAG TPA: SRPBCC family protein [Nocardioidaceae bacterium]
MTAGYRFEHAWSVPLPREELFEVLADVGGYPTWWPQVRAVARVDDDTAHVVARSVLPYTLDLVLVRAVEDPVRGVLEARLRGQLDGWSRWSLGREDGNGSTPLRYEQEVTVHGTLLATASRVARPLLEANHTWMMRGGRQGLLRRGVARGGSTAR